MTEIILKEIAKNITAKCAFLSKPCGVARLQVENVNKKIKKYPVIPNPDISTCNAQPYLDMIPSTKDTVLCYFEVINNRIVENKTMTNVYNSTVRLVCWINTKRIEHYREGAVENNILKSISKNDLDLPTGLNLSYIRELFFEPKDANIFAKYSYNEAEQQYLMLPFDFFSVYFEIQYSHNPNCCAEIVLTNDTNQC